MPSSSAKAAEKMAYDTVRTAPFTRIHGRPTRQDYETLKQEASDLASEVANITFAWSWDTATGEEYGLLAESSVTPNTPISPTSTGPKK